jgi:hypothetical protein
MPSSSAPSILVPVLEMELQGHLTDTVLEAALVSVTGRLVGGTTSFRLLVDCLRMTGYDSAARALFVEWNKKHRRRIERVAVLTEKVIWHMVISAMSLASRQDMRPFTDRAAALGWLQRI